MSFYNTPLKHGKGVNKPFRSPLIQNDQNDGTPRRKDTSAKQNQNLRIKSLGLKSPINSRGFNSPMKPLLLTSPKKPLETEILTKCSEYSSPLKRIENNILIKRPRKNSLKLLHDNSSEQTPKNNLDVKPFENDSSVKLKESCSTLKTENSCTENFSKNEIHSTKQKMDLVTNGEKPPFKCELIKTPPISPKILQAIESPEYQPVVKLQRLSPSIVDINKKELALLIKRIAEKQRQMVELRAKIPTYRKHNLEEIVVSIGKWREAFSEALETLRTSLTEKNGRSFSTSEVLKLLCIPNNIVHFSEEVNDYIFPKI